MSTQQDPATLHQISQDLTTALANDFGKPWNPQHFELTVAAMANVTDRLKMLIGAVNHHGAKNHTNARVQQQLHTAGEWLTLAAKTMREAQQYAEEQRTAPAKKAQRRKTVS